MGRITRGSLTSVEATWIIATRLAAGESFTIDEAARLVSGRSQSEWYGLSARERLAFRRRARRILVAGEACGMARSGAIIVADNAMTIWEGGGQYDYD